MPQRDVMAKASELETALIEAGVDQETATELIDELEIELRDLLDEVDQDLEKAGSESDSEPDDREDR